MYHETVDDFFLKVHFIYVVFLFKINQLMIDVDSVIYIPPVYDSAAAGFAHSSPDKTPGDREKQFDPRREEKLSGRKVETMENLRVDDYQGSGRTPMNTPLSTCVAPPTTQISDEPAKVFVHGHDDAPKVNLTRPHGLKEDPDEGPTSRSRPPPNYETKVTGPTHTGGTYLLKLNILIVYYLKLSLEDSLQCVCILNRVFFETDPGILTYV